MKLIDHSYSYIYILVTNISELIIYNAYVYVIVLLLVQIMLYREKT